MAESPPTTPTAANLLWEWGRERGFPEIAVRLRGFFLSLKNRQSWADFITLANDEELMAAYLACVESEGV